MLAAQGRWSCSSSKAVSGASSSAPQYKKVRKPLEQVQWRPVKRIKELDHLSYKEWMGLLKLERRQLREDLVNVCQYLKGGVRGWILGSCPWCQAIKWKNLMNKYTGSLINSKAMAGHRRKGKQELYFLLPISHFLGSRLWVHTAVALEDKHCNNECFCIWVDIIRYEVSLWTVWVCCPVVSSPKILPTWRDSTDSVPALLSSNQQVCNEHLSRWQYTKHGTMRTALVKMSPSSDRPTYKEWTSLKKSCLKI